MALCEDTDADPARFTFDSSTLFVPGAALVLVHIAALVTRAAQAVAGREQRVGSWEAGELVCSVWLVLSFFGCWLGVFLEREVVGFLGSNLDGCGFGRSLVAALWAGLGPVHYLGS